MIQVNNASLYYVYIYFNGQYSVTTKYEVLMYRQSWERAAARWRALRHPGEGRIDRGCGPQWGRRLGFTIHLPPRINGRPHAVSLLYHPAVPLAPLEPVRRQRVYSYAILSRIRSLNTLRHSLALIENNHDARNTGPH